MEAFVRLSENTAGPGETAARLRFPYFGCLGPFYSMISDITGGVPLCLFPFLNQPLCGGRILDLTGKATFLFRHGNILRFPGQVAEMLRRRGIYWRIESQHM